MQALFHVGRLVLSAFLLCVTVGSALQSNAAPEQKKRQGAFPHLRFVVYGDTRDGHDTHRRLVALIMKQKPDFVLQTGDLVAEGGNNRLWKVYDEITGAMRAKVPVYPARGNHDLGGPGYEARVPTSFTSGNKLYYSFDKENCHFVSLDVFSPYAPGSVQYAWLEKDLAEAHKKARHTFVFFHVAPYSIGDVHGSDLRLRARLCPLFHKYGVRTVFNGHDHIYYRTTRDGVLYFVTGGGGAPLYGCQPDHGAIPGDKWESAHHIVVCDVDGDRVEYEALREDGSELDHYILPVKP